MTYRLIAIALAILGVMLVAGGRGAHAEQGADLSFPWEAGRSWLYLNGPHNGNAAVPAALDFQPPDARGQPCGFRSDAWVVAAADGRVINLQNAIEIDHGNGFRTGYFHLGDKQVTSGYVSAGERLGHPDCCPEGGEPIECYSDTPHLHFYTVYNGAKQDITGITIQGWTVQDDGCLQKGDQRSCPGDSLRSAAPPVDETLPSVAADIAIVVDGSDASRQAARQFLQALYPGDRAGIVSFGDSVERVAGLAVPGIPLGITLAGSVSRGDADPAGALIEACILLSEEGRAPADAVIAFGAGWRTGEALDAAAECLGPDGPKAFVYDTGADTSGAVIDALTAAGNEYHALSQVRDLPCEFQRVRSEISDDGLTACSSFLLREGEIVSVPFAITEGQASATFSVSWSSAEGVRPHVHSVLLDPAHARTGPSAPGVTKRLGISFQAFSAQAPAPGNWKVYVDADGLPAEGVTLRLTSSSTAKPVPGAAAPFETPKLDEGNTTDTDEPTPTGSGQPSPTLRPKKTVPPKPSPTPSRPTATPEETLQPTPAPSPEPTNTPAPLPTPPQPPPPPRT